jgi:hypothetical protein
MNLCVLTYGDHLPLVTRCLQSLGAAAGFSRVVVGCNSVSPRVFDYVRTWAAAAECPAALCFPENNQNALKYPLMRFMFSVLPAGGRVMWFDDDSYRDDASAAWLSSIENQVTTKNTDVGGHLYRMRLTIAQRAWLTRQPWYTQDVPPVVTFPTGGWWVADLSALRRFCYPFSDLLHNGGDVMLGALCRTQSLTLSPIVSGVRVNADDVGAESKAVRRGVSQSPIGTEMHAKLLADWRCPSFVCEVLHGRF